MKISIITFVCASLFVGGCVTDNVKFPDTTANFVPRREYAMPYDELWQAALAALDENHIAVISANKTVGIIRTDYIAGPGEVMIPLGVSQQTRYKYSINLRDQFGGAVKLNIFCTIEDSVSNARTTGEWHEVTSQNMALENRLEAWLYEQIENEIRSQPWAEKTSPY